MFNILKKSIDGVFNPNFKYNKTGLELLILYAIF